MTKCNRIKIQKSNILLQPGTTGIGLYTRYQYIVYLGTCTFVHGSLLWYNTVCIYICVCVTTAVCVELYMYVWPSQPGKVANPARGQRLNRENELFAVLLRA